MSEPGTPRLTLVLGVLTAVALFLSLPGSLREAFARGGVYVVSREFLEDLPKRLTGPGRFRFVLQPAFAIVLGVRAGRADAKSGGQDYLHALWSGRGGRGNLIRQAWKGIANLVLAGVLVDSVCQWLILGVSYPGAALLFGPVLIGAPYAASRSLANRIVTGRAPNPDP